MKKILSAFISTAAAILFPNMAAAQENSVPLPDGTYKFAQRDTCELFLDVYNPAAGTLEEGHPQMPTVIFMFGGGFMSGERDMPYYNRWFREMTENGCRIVSIDYRLGLKGATKVGIGQVNELENAINMAVEDLFSATVFLLDNAESLGIDPDNIVISGSSAGAISVLQADYEMNNNSVLASVLPEGFRYAGVISFSGAILSRSGLLEYMTEPSPTLLMHGTEDRLVTYRQIKFFNIGFFGSDRIASRFEKFGYEYNILRFAGHGHEIAGSMYETMEYQMAFIKENILRKSRRIIDATIYDPDIPSGEGTSQSRKELYGNSR